MYCGKLFISLMDRLQFSDGVFRVLDFAVPILDKSWIRREKRWFPQSQPRGEFLTGVEMPVNRALGVQLWFGPRMG